MLPINQVNACVPLGGLMQGMHRMIGTLHGMIDMYVHIVPDGICISDKLCDSCDSDCRLSVHFTMSSIPYSTQLVQWNAVLTQFKSR